MLIMDGPAGSYRQEILVRKSQALENAGMDKTKVGNSDQDFTGTPLVTHPTVKKGESKLRDIKYT